MAGWRLLRFIFGRFLEFGYFQQVLYGVDHASDLRRIFYAFGATHFAEAEGLHSTLLTLGAVNNAFYEFDLDLRHLLLTVKNLGESNAASLCNLHGVTHFQQGIEGSFYHVVGVRRTFRLGKYVFDTSAFENGTHSTTSNYTGTSSSWLNQHEAARVFAFHDVGNRVLIQRNLHQVFLRVVNAFSNGVGYFVGFAQAVAYGAVAVTYYHDGREAKATTAFYYFGYAVDSNHFLFQIGVTGTRLFLPVIAATVIATTTTVITTATVVAATTTRAVVKFCHDDLEIEAAFAGSFCQ